MMTDSGESKYLEKNLS